MNAAQWNIYGCRIAGKIEGFEFVEITDVNSAEFFGVYVKGVDGLEEWAADFPSLEEAGCFVSLRQNAAVNEKQLHSGFPSASA